MRHVWVGVCLVFTAGCWDASYNALIWNRDNVLRHTGLVDTGPWFEWWYYKVVVPETGDAFCITYGVVNPWDVEGKEPASLSYVSLVNYATHEITMSEFPAKEFNARYDMPDVQIGSSSATACAVTGTLADDTGAIVSWDMNVKNKWAYNAMGWAMYVPEITNIFWYPAQADARFSGSIDYKGNTYRFENAPGYQDRNWGRSFPEWWAWIVSNNFDGHPDAALAAGGGKPIILGITDAIAGISIGLRHAGKEYNFRPNDGDHVRFIIDFGTWIVEAENNSGQRIELQATDSCDDFMDLVFPTPQGGFFHDFETLTGKLDVRLYERGAEREQDWLLLDSLHSEFAGIEYGRSDLAASDCFQTESRVLFSNF